MLLFGGWLFTIGVDTTMPFIGLTPYSIRIKRRRAKGPNFEPIAAFDGATDFLDVFREALLQPGVFSVPDQADKSFEALPKTDSSRILDGNFSVGQSGYGSTIKDRSGADAFKRRVTHSEFIPLYYRLNDNVGGPDFCSVMLQSFNRAGLKTIIDSRLKLFFSKEYPDYTLHFNRIVSSAEAKKIFTNNPLKKVRFIQRKVPKDKADKIAHGGSQHEGEIELILKAKGENPFGLRKKIGEFFSGSRALTDIVELSDIDYEDVKLEMEIEGKSRTLTLSRVDSMNNTFDITEDVDCDEDEHPEIESIRVIASEIEGELLGKIE